MKDDKCDISKICPYHRQSGDCRMTAGGLYLPLLHHVEAYCRTVGYVNCSHYIKGKSLLDKSRAERVLVESGRRRFQREKKKFVVEVRNCDSSGHPLDVADLQTVTVDLSQGGMRLESNKKIPVSSLLAFSFGKDFPIPGLIGNGQVRWSRERTGADKYEAGLCFTDNQMQNMIGAHLGL